MTAIKCGLPPAPARIPATYLQQRELNFAACRKRLFRCRTRVEQIGRWSYCSAMISSHSQMSLRWRALLAFAIVGMMLLRGLGAGVDGDNFAASEQNAALSAYCGHASTGSDDSSGGLHPDCCAFCTESGRQSPGSIFLVATLISLLFPDRDASGASSFSRETQPTVGGRAISVAQPRAPPILS